MLVIGLTGGIASGKSTVSALFKSHNVPVVDLDILARKAVEPGSSALTQIAKTFGADRVLRDDGSLDRDALGQIIFADERERRKLNAIVHPAVRRLMFTELIRCWLRGERIAVVDAPLLVEAGLWRMCGRIVIVYCSEALQLQRLLNRNGGSEEAARQKIGAQRPLSSKLVFADHVIDNSGSLQELESQVDRIIGRLNRDAGWLWVVSWLIPPVGIASGLLTVLWRLFVKKVGSEPRRRRKAIPPGARRETIELSSMPSSD